MSSLRDFLTKVFVLFHQNVIPTGLANDAICRAYGTTIMASLRDWLMMLFVVPKHYHNGIPTGLVDDAICRAYGTTIMAFLRVYVQSHRINFFVNPRGMKLG